MKRFIPAGLLAIVLAAALALTGCPWSDPFPEYRGVNLITDRGLSVDSFADAYMDGSDPAATFDYVQVSDSLTAAEYGTAAGLPSGAETTIRRLEAVNLFPNGDFEASAAGSPPPLWDIDAAVPPPITPPSNFTVDDSGQILGQSVAFSVAGTGVAVLDMDANFPDGCVESATYFLSLQFRRSVPTMEITFDYGDASTTSYLIEQNVPWIVDGRTDDQTPLETLPTSGDPLLDLVTTFSSSATSSNYFYVGSPQVFPGEAGYLDNIRMGRLDGIPHVAVPIALENATGTLPLVASYYRVSVWVKSEIDDQITPSANGQNRFRAGQIVLGMNNHPLELFTQEEVGWSTDTWQLVSADFRLTAADLQNDPPMQIRLSVIHPESPVVGSVLIADPRVEIASYE